ncbi:MAG TPA: PIN domain-containing protein [Bacteroidales bacterium]|nr:PIN domain-containing protein [Bacteroidales bacterium]
MDYRYWDSNCFLKWLKKEPDYEKCKGVLYNAENNKLKIVTSALTIAEVIYLHPSPKMTREKSDEICRMFERDYIVTISVDRVIAEEARELLWQYKALKPKDAIHVASAIRANVVNKSSSIILDTFDEDLIKLSGKIGTPPLIIGSPNIEYQERIFAGEDKEKGDEEDLEEAADG